MKWQIMVPSLCIMNHIKPMKLSYAYDADAVNVNANAVVIVLPLPIVLQSCFCGKVGLYANFFLNSSASGNNNIYTGFSQYTNLEYKCMVRIYLDLFLLLHLVTTKEEKRLRKVVQSLFNCKYRKCGALAPVYSIYVL
jgi:hypothetical protein